MVQRSRPHGRDFLPVVALWKDPVRGLREIKVEAGVQGVLLTLCGKRTARRSADGRYPVDNATEYFDVAVHQVRAGSAAASMSKSKSEALESRSLELDELTILTGWAQALVEAAAYAPESVQNVLANASAGAMADGARAGRAIPVACRSDGLHRSSGQFLGRRADTGRTTRLVPARRRSAG
jgi:hypothetical protein